MKNFIRTSCLFALLGFSTSFAIQSQIPEAGYHVIRLEEVTDSAVTDFFGGLLPQVAIEIPEGAGIPISLSLTGEFLHLEPNGEKLHTIRVVKTCYLRSADGIPLFSTDLETWARFDDFFTGTVNLSLDTSNHIPKVGLGIELNQKD